MDLITLANIANAGPWVFIAYVFFKGYFKDKEQNYEFNKAVLAFQERMAVILSDANETLKQNHVLVKDTKEMHDDMDEKIQKIFDQMATAQSQKELITAVNSLRKAWEEMR